jgi:hypothetical protein
MDDGCGRFGCVFFRCLRRFGFTHFASTRHSARHRYSRPIEQPKAAGNSVCERCRSGLRALFNHFFDDTRKLLNKATIGPWISHASARQRVFGISRVAYTALANPSKPMARETALKQMEAHYEELFQRRHDCIHNCDRPRTAIQPITQTSAEKTVEDVTFLVERCLESLRSEFPLYLQARGFNGVTRNQVLQ